MLTEIKEFCGHLVPVKRVTIFSVVEYQALSVQVFAIAEYKIHYHGSVGKGVAVRNLYHGVGILCRNSYFGSTTADGL